MTKSDSIGQLALALSAAQGNMKNAKKDSANPFFKSKYADLASVTDACRQELSEQCLAVVQLPTTRDGKLVLEYVLMHESGEYIASELELTPVKSDPQGIGSAITYARRYTLAALTGVATEDDDGNAASGNDSKSHRNVPVTTEETVIEKPKSTAGNSTQAANQKGAAPAVDKPQPADAKDIAKALIDAHLKPKELRDLQREAKASLSVKPAELPADAIGIGQATNFCKLFHDALRPELQSQSESIRRVWLKKAGIVDGDGNGTAKAILKDNFYETRDDAIAYAKSLEVWP